MPVMAKARTDPDISKTLITEMLHAGKLQRICSAPTTNWMWSGFSLQTEIYRLDNLFKINLEESKSDVF
jgi:hypothetical protein